MKVNCLFCPVRRQNKRKVNKKMKQLDRIVIILSVTGFLIAATAKPGLAQSKSDSLIMSAMRDEINRSFNDLKDDADSKPFFISYTIANSKSFQISASLGALSRSKERQFKDWHARLMVGDYKINDENFSSIQPDEAVYRKTIQMPVEDDYDGIRRSLWLTTNNLFFSASRSYREKMSLIEEKQISEADLEIEDFSRTPVVKKRIYSSASKLDKAELENTAKKLSSLFIDHPEVYSSQVSISVFESTIYFVNTEGSEVQFPFSLTILTVQAQSITDDSDQLNKKIEYIASGPEKLPSEESIESDILKILDNLAALKSAPRFDDTYFGPVLVIGEIAAETMEKFLFSGSDALIANREVLQLGTQRSVFYNKSENNLQGQLGKPILASNLTITAEPGLKEYLGNKLIGSYDIDAEAVVPLEKLVLVENGVLKTLLNGRTPTREVPASNGHMRFHYNQLGLNQTVGPGVIKINASITLPLEEMKEELMKVAHEQGLDYALIIRSLDVGGFDKPFNFYRVDVQTGEEQLIRAVRLRNLTFLSLRRAPEFAETELIHNTLISVYQENSDDLSGIPCSFILPGAVLLKEVEMDSYRKPLTSLLPLIENPVIKLKQEEKAISVEKP
jgi:hypothetical protein